MAHRAQGSTGESSPRPSRHQGEVAEAPGRGGHLQGIDLPPRPLGAHGRGHGRPRGRYPGVPPRAPVWALLDPAASALAARLASRCRARTGRGDGWLRHARPRTPEALPGHSSRRARAMVVASGAGQSPMSMIVMPAQCRMSLPMRTWTPSARIMGTSLGVAIPTVSVRVLPPNETFTSCRSTFITSIIGL